MSNFDRQWQEEIILPDGSSATSRADVDRYLKASHLALAGDYSDGYFRAVRRRQEKERRADLFAEFVRNYKRKIWDDN